MKNKVMRAVIYILFVTLFVSTQAAEKFGLASYDWSNAYQGDNSLYSSCPVHVENFVDVENLEPLSGVVSSLDEVGDCLTEGQSSLVDHLDQNVVELNEQGLTDEIQVVSSASRISAAAKKRLKKKRQKDKALKILEKDAIEDALLKQAKDQSLAEAYVLVEQRKVKFISDALPIKEAEIGRILKLLEKRKLSQETVERIKASYEHVFLLDVDFQSRNLPAGFYIWGDFWTTFFVRLGFVSVVSCYSLHDSKTRFISSDLQNHMRSFLDEENYCIQENFDIFLSQKSKDSSGYDRSIGTAFSDKLKNICEIQTVYMRLKEDHGVVDSACSKNFEVIKKMYARSLEL